MTKRPSLSACFDHAGEIEHERAIRLDADAGESRGMGSYDRGRADGRKVDPQLLSGLGAFDQHAALLAGDPAMPAQPLDPFEKAVRAFDAFKRHRAPADGDRRLADVECADGAGGRQSRIDVAPVSLEGRHASHRPGGGQQVRDDLMRPDDPDAVGFDHAGERAQQTVVALGQRGQRARQERKEREARLHCAQLRTPADAAGKHGVGHAVPLEHRGKAGEILERKILVLEGREARGSLALHHHDEGRMPVRCQAFGKIDRQPAASCNDGDLVARLQPDAAARLSRLHRRCRCLRL